MGLHCSSEKFPEEDRDRVYDLNCALENVYHGNRLHLTTRATHLIAGHADNTALDFLKERIDGEQNEFGEFQCHSCEDLGDLPNAVQPEKGPYHRAKYPAELINVTYVVSDREFQSDIHSIGWTDSSSKFCF